MFDKLCLCTSNVGKSNHNVNVASADLLPLAEALVADSFPSSFLLDHGIHCTTWLLEGGIIIPCGDYSVRAFIWGQYFVGVLAFLPLLGN